MTKVTPIGNAKKQRKQNAISAAVEKANENYAKGEAQIANLKEQLELVAGNVEALLQTAASLINLQMQMAEADMATGDPNLIIRAEETYNRMNQAMPQGFCDLANMDFRNAFMRLRRALEQPTHF